MFTYITAIIEIYTLTTVYLKQLHKSVFVFGDLGEDKVQKSGESSIMKLIQEKSGRKNT